VLRETAARLTRAVRVVDMVARLGGDEFAVLAPDPTPEVMRALADSVLAGLRDLGHEGLRVTASLGWVIHPDDASTVDDLIAAADFCLRGAQAHRQGPGAVRRGLGAGAGRGAGGLGRVLKNSA
jgi:diguanylate cyclase (GGDEF)-like protein